MRQSDGGDCNHCGRIWYTSDMTEQEWYGVLGYNKKDNPHTSSLIHSFSRSLTLCGLLLSHTSSTILCAFLGGFYNIYYLCIVDSTVTSRCNQEWYVMYRSCCCLSPNYAWAIIHRSLIRFHFSSWAHFRSHGGGNCELVKRLMMQWQYEWGSGYYVCLQWVGRYMPRWLILV